MTLSSADGQRLCLSAQDPNIAAGGYVVAAPCNGAAAQRFVMGVHGLQLGPTLCLDAGQRVVLGSLATLQPCDSGRESQAFAFAQGVLYVRVRDINFALSRGSLDASLQAPLSMTINDPAQPAQQWIGGLVTSGAIDAGGAGVTLSPAAQLTQCLDVANRMLVLNTCTASASQRFVWLPSGAMQMGTLCAHYEPDAAMQASVVSMLDCSTAPPQSWSWRQGQLGLGDKLCLLASDANQLIDAPVTLGPCDTATGTWTAGASVTP